MKQRLAASSWGARTSVGRVRQANEDCWGEFGGQWFIVADGIGGEAGGEIASTAAVARLMRLATKPTKPPWNLLLEDVNEAVRTELRQTGTPEGGTTLVALRLDGAAPSLAHIGDSRAYRLGRQSTTLEHLTDDHSVAAELRAAGQSVEAYDRNVGRSDALTRYVGGDRAFAPSENEPVLEAGDRVLLCTDGIHGQLPVETLSSEVGRGTCEDAARRLVQLADDAGGKDNATAVVVELGWA